LSKAAKTRNDLAWDILFEKYDILKHVENEGSFSISSGEINRDSHREARLMTKFDHKSNLPDIFKCNNLSILPSSRGSYLISDFELYFSVTSEESKEVKRIEFPEALQSIDSEDIYSESAAISCAYISGMLGEFLNEQVLYPTVSGRMSSGSFRFCVDRESGGRYRFVVNNSQIEIDGGFEGRDSLALIEAKNSVSSDFIIRQLYYPFRLWNTRILKVVRPVLLTYSNGFFDIREFRFRNENHYNSIHLVKHERYTFEAAEVSLSDIQGLFDTTELIEEPDIPFPQADLFERVVNLCELLLGRKRLTAEEITLTYDFDGRQTAYYTNAGRYLGLIQKERRDDVFFCLTESGSSLFKLSHKQRQLRYAQLILQHRAFYETLKLYFAKADSPTKDEIVDIMKQCRLYNVGTDGLFRRRASTVAGWVNWILGLQCIQRSGTEGSFQT
jgi:hypothetical protein